MKIKLLGTVLAITLTSHAMATNYFKLMAAAFAASSIARAGTTCNNECNWHPSFDSFQDYLADLSYCEMEQLVGVMDERYNFVKQANEAFKEIPQNLNRRGAHEKMEAIYELYKKEIVLLRAELQKTQELLFDDCTSEVSKEILAKHISVLTDAIAGHENHLRYIEELISDSRTN
jgi:hypothetical protein